VLDALAACCPNLRHLMTDMPCETASLIGFLRSRSDHRRHRRPEVVAGSRSSPSPSQSSAPSPVASCFRFVGCRPTATIETGPPFEEAAVAGRSLLETCVPLDELCALYSAPPPPVGLLRWPPMFPRSTCEAALSGSEDGRVGDSGSAVASSSSLLPATVYSAPTNSTVSNSRSSSDAVPNETSPAETGIGPAEFAELRCAPPLDSGRFGRVVDAFPALRALTFVRAMSNAAETEVPLRRHTERGLDTLRRLRLVSPRRDVGRLLSWFPRIERLELQNCGAMTLAALTGCTAHLGSLRHLVCTKRSIDTIARSFSDRLAALAVLLPRLTRLTVLTCTPDSAHADDVETAVARLRRTALAISRSAAVVAAAAAIPTSSASSLSVSRLPLPPPPPAFPLSPFFSRASVARTEPIVLTWRQCDARSEFDAACLEPLGAVD
jgi:hypothetical protein